MEAFLEEFQHLFQHLNHFNLKEIMSITGAFDKKNLIGRGGFGKVYRGVVSDSKGQIQAAFKRLDSNYGQGNPEFLKEIILLSRYTHENLISLMGFCDEDGEKILVYEHAAHGSLDAHLSSSTLTWTQRLKICLGAAKGLCYLHDPKETQQRVIHRDIKSSNILLDEKWNAKVSDMGLSKIGPANQVHSFLATNVAGTFCYIDPLYMETSILTKESDVYSFGVVLFEVLCGSLCFENNNGRLQSFVRRWRKSYKEKKLEEIIFPHMKQHMDVRSLETFSEIAYRCLQNSRAERPSMSQVVEKLEIALQFQAAIAIGPLIHVLETGSSEAKENSAATLLSLSVIEDNKIWIGMSGAIGPLVDLLGHGTPRGKKDAATALFNLSIFHENKARIVQAGAVKYLVELMDPAGGMVDKAVAVLSNLATLPEGRAAIGQEGGIPMLVEVVELGSATGKENAAAALLQLCINSSRFCNIVLQEGAVPPLVALSQSGTPRAKEKAQSLLSFFRNQRQANGGRG